jgi:hypothetical protein
LHDEYYECNDCGKQFADYHHMVHPDEHTGGFCTCGSDDLKVMRLVTVYQEFYAPEDYDLDDTMQIAYELDEWQMTDFAIRLKENSND